MLYLLNWTQMRKKRNWISTRNAFGRF